jgi:predicted transcriptional regulator
MERTEYAYARGDPIDAKIVATIAQNPGSLTNDIAAAAGIGTERCRYRLLTLELQGRVHSVKERQLRRYYLATASDRGGVDAHA